jgi:hypothetical protein
MSFLCTGYPWQAGYPVSFWLLVNPAEKTASIGFGWRLRVLARGSGFGACGYDKPGSLAKARRREEEHPYSFFGARWHQETRGVLRRVMPGSFTEPLGHRESFRDGFPWRLRVFARGSGFGSRRYEEIHVSHGARWRRPQDPGACAAQPGQGQPVADCPYPAPGFNPQRPGPGGGEPSSCFCGFSSSGTQPALIHDGIAMHPAGR